MIQFKPIDHNSVRGYDSLENFLIHILFGENDLKLIERRNMAFTIIGQQSES